jgi:hypothetical protein
MKSARLMGLAAALAVALALPAAARASDDQSCYGKLAPIAKSAERDTGVTYTFVCGQPVKAFGITTNVQTSSFDVAADVFDPKDQGGAIRGDDRFGECIGGLPGYGFTCAGAYSALGRVVTATFDTMDDPCARDASRHVILRGGLIVENANGTLGGPYDLGKITGCPKPAKAKAQKKGKRAKKAAHAVHRPRTP